MLVMDGNIGGGGKLRWIQSGEVGGKEFEFRDYQAVLSSIKDKIRYVLCRGRHTGSHCYMPSRCVPPFPPHRSQGA